MPNIGLPELILILVVVLIIFGPGKLPDIGNAIGRGVREFRKASTDLEETIRGDTKPKPPSDEAASGVSPAAGAPNAGSPSAGSTPESK